MHSCSSSLCNKNAFHYSDLFSISKTSTPKIIESNTNSLPLPRTKRAKFAHFSSCNLFRIEPFPRLFLFAQNHKRRKTHIQLCMFKTFFASGTRMHHKQVSLERWRNITVSGLQKFSKLIIHAIVSGNAWERKSLVLSFHHFRLRNVISYLYPLCDMIFPITRSHRERESHAKTRLITFIIQHYHLKQCSPN